MASVLALHACDTSAERATGCVWYHVHKGTMSVLLPAVVVLLLRYSAETDAAVI